MFIFCLHVEDLRGGIEKIPEMDAWESVKAFISRFKPAKKKPLATRDVITIPHPLQLTHRLLFVLHLGQAIATSVLAALLSQTYKSTVYYKDDKLFTVPVTALIPAFFGISAAGHFYAGWFANLYRRMARFICPERWGEYALSASLMSVIIALLCRIDDVVLLAGILVLQMVVMAWGYVVERDMAKIARSKGVYTHDMATEDGKPTELFWIASVAELLIWGTTLIYYIDAVVGATSSVPWFVHAVVGTLLVCYTAYPILMFWYQRKLVNTKLNHPDADTQVSYDDTLVKQQWLDATDGKSGHTPLVEVYETAERGYMVLSFVAKTALGWIVFAGAAMNDKNN